MELLSIGLAVGLVRTIGSDTVAMSSLNVGNTDLSRVLPLPLRKSIAGSPQATTPGSGWAPGPGAAPGVARRLLGACRRFAASGQECVQDRNLFFL